MSKESTSKGSKSSTILYLLFIIAFLCLFGFLNLRLIDYPSQNVEDITIYFYLVLIILILVFSIGLVFIYGKVTNKSQLISKLNDLTYWVLLICIGGLSWSLRGIWGHQTGTLVWGTLVGSVLMLKNRRDNYLLFIFFLNLGLALGAMMPFATYPFIPRFVLFGFWGMLGTFFAVFGRYLFYGRRFNSQENIKEFHIKFTLIGFIGLGLGITFANAFQIDEGWISGWLGGYITGGFFSAIVGYFLHLNNKKFSEEIESPEFLKLYVDVTESKSNLERFIKICIYCALFCYVPIAGFLNIGDYYFNELGYSDFPFYLIIIISVIYFAIGAIFIIKYSNKLGKIDNKNIELLILFLVTLWPSSLSAILRNSSVTGLPDFAQIIVSYEFERSVLCFALISTFLFLLYLLITRSLTGKEE